MTDIGIVGPPHLPGDSLGLIWALPFSGLMLSIALGPQCWPKAWENQYGKIAAGWALILLVPLAVIHGTRLAVYEFFHVMLTDYLPFMIMISALYIVTGGIRLVGDRVGTPLLNTAVIGLGTILASVMGTTGASMIVIRPLLHANRHRTHVRHTVVFTIFLVANIGGALTPLGDPPLFLGFLHGVSFFWTFSALWLQTLLISVVLLALYYALDSYYLRQEPPRSEDPGDPDPVAAQAEGGGAGGLRLEGGSNLVLLVGVLVAVLISGLWTDPRHLEVFHVPVAVAAVVRDAVLVVIAALSWRLTPREVRQRNHFAWHPVVEVAVLFAGIFVTIIPVAAMLHAGPAGALAPVLALVTDAQGQPLDRLYFWVTGGLSSVLDNAPTYLVFFNAAGGDAERLMTAGASTLAAISAGAVYMGAMTYVGNAPNMMIRAIAVHRGIAMPGFFGYLVWSGGILMPLFGLTSVLFFR